MNPLAIRFGTLHTNAGEPLRNGIIIVDDGKIASISNGIPLGGMREFEAACVVPGLINCHVHFEMSGEPQTMAVFKLTSAIHRAYACAENARKTIESGVTSVRDLAGTESLAIELRDAVAAGKVPGPTILAAGYAITMTGGHGFFAGRETDGPWDVRKAVREQLRAGADCVKFIATGGVLTKGAVPGIAQLSEEELRAGIAEAHQHGLRCAAHAIGTVGIKNALWAGIDSIEHGHLIDEEGIALMVERGAYLVPTLAAPACIVEAGPDAGLPDFVLRKARELEASMHQNLQRAREAGVKFAGGSDAGTPFNGHDNYAYEVELMTTKLGMSAREALHAATANAADLLGVARGRLKVGEVADLVLLDRDIVDDVRTLRTPIAVIKGGAVAFERR